MLLETFSVPDPGLRLPFSFLFEVFSRKWHQTDLTIIKVTAYNIKLHRNSNKPIKEEEGYTYLLLQNQHTHTRTHAHTHTHTHTYLK